MSAVPEVPGQMTEAEYLAFERASEFKHEYVDGEIFAMTGGSGEHSLIIASTIIALGIQTRGGSCRVFSNDIRVRASLVGSYFYPDVAIVCGEIEYTDDHLDTLANPTLIIEVLSPSTERYDRGKKFQIYRELKSLQEYLLVAQDSPHIERYLRQENNIWQFNDAKGLEATLELPSIGCTLALAEVYEQVTFSSEEDNS
jgi:Uma2 family endonuclease